MNQSSHFPLSRRRFLRQSAAAAFAGVAFPALISSAARGADGATAPSGKIAVALIGCGPRGIAVMKGFLAEETARVIAVCDVKPEQIQLARAAVNQQYGNQDCAAYADFRELLARSDLDAVIVATPDHWHVLIGIAAVRAGKDVYVEKPLGLTVAEDQAMRAAVRATGRIFQFGTQQRSSAFFRRACEIVRNGRIGKLKHINAWSMASVPGGSLEEKPVPAGMNYDLWLGPAPAKPYRGDICSADSAKKTWWFNSDYAIGFIAGWGVHPMDIAQWGCADMFTGAITVAGTGIYPTEGACDTATKWDVNFEFASGVTLNFQGLPVLDNGGPTTRDAKLWEEKYGRTTNHGTAFEGTDGWVMVDRAHVVASNPDLLKEPEENYAVQLPRSDYHAQNFLESIRSRRPAIANMEEAFRSDVLCHLADIAARSGRKLVWDSSTEKFRNDDAADRRLALRPARAPWTFQ